MAAIVDIDGTLLLNGVRPNSAVIGIVSKLPDVFLVTGRPETDRQRTIKQLAAAGITYVQLMMNNFGNDPTAQLESKRFNAQQIMKHAKVTTAIDDNAAARRMYKSLGIPNVSAP
jgi:hydroxymethylpyrimidine pyrophosphatase-like HAD family hydrolase